MSDRRNFIKAGLATIGAATVGVVIAPKSLSAAEAPAAPAAKPPFSGIIYSKENPGQWSEKVKGHAPQVKVEGDKVSIITNHSMSEKHYIVRHTLVTDGGDVVGEKTFYPSDEAAKSEFELPEGVTKLYATSFCNKHDMWVTEFTV
ncbi:desulfoferrodoxin family protein [Candidatus Venteria ishoeyi]|uniref:Desulfoferrodoxin n=1 Tax=Candidatus Venteria ishoeyi TaxID=1899563 RepID=A0A1H6FGJ2_9GAMM|nr:desulfoferrodoxin family protein [Candidatus Venteria ishoeyi]MDM8547913.1 desulfoferrodoxin family protein [Candidatus Venteria ishoeyi]SEH08773.1 Desulfoferrodoxin [Candidatus Venteria ishoeyi]